MIYLDYAATAPLLPEAEEKILLAMREFGNPDSLHAAGRRAAQIVTDARDRIAGFLGVLPSEVYFTSGGTEADNWAVRGMGRGKALLSPVEHAACLSALPLRKEGGVLSGVSEDGTVRVSDLEALSGGEIGLVCVMAANNETGCVQPVAELARFAHERGALFFTDCVQAACSLDLRSIAALADGLSLSAHKLGGPKGTGALIVKKGVPLTPLIAGGEQERGLRGGTLNVAGIAGFAEALTCAVRERERFVRHTGFLRDLFEKTLFEALGDGVRRDGETRVPNISHLTFRAGGEFLVNLLDRKGIAASAGAACSAHAAKPSHVLLAMGRSPEEAKKGVRFSFGMQTTEEETLLCARTVAACLGGRT